MCIYPDTHIYVNSPKHTHTHTHTHTYVCVCVCVCDLLYTIKMKVAQLCLTLCDPMDYVVNGILQGRILEWVAFPFSRGSS